MRRVRVVRRPLPDYVGSQFSWGYVYNVAAGEDIRVLDLTDQQGPDLSDHDFWLFDEQTVVQLMYRPDGTQIGASCCTTQISRLTCGIAMQPGEMGRPLVTTGQG